MLKQFITISCNLKIKPIYKCDFKFNFNKQLMKQLTWGFQVVSSYYLWYFINQSRHYIKLCITNDLVLKQLVDISLQHYSLRANREKMNLVSNSQMPLHQ